MAFPYVIFGDPPGAFKYAQFHPPMDPETRNVVIAMVDSDDVPEGGITEALMSIHAPSVTVSLLRQAGMIRESAAEELPNETIFFPKRVRGKSMLASLNSHVRLASLRIQYTTWQTCSKLEV